MTQLPHVMWNLSSLIRDQTGGPAVRALSPCHWTTREFLTTHTDYLTVSVPQEFRYSQTECTAKLDGAGWWGTSSKCPMWLLAHLGSSSVHLSRGYLSVLVVTLSQPVSEVGSRSPQTFWVDWAVMVITSAIVLSFKTSYQLYKFWIETYEKKIFLSHNNKRQVRNIGIKI